jgi:ribosomal protein S18 acetylase RimI-like enzyme
MALVEIVPITQGHIESFHRTLDFVARERRYLSFLEAPSIASTQGYILDNIKHGYPHRVALSAGEVVGWCDVIPKTRPAHAHCGVLGMGLMPPYRRQGIGTRLMQGALAASRAFGLHRVELTVREDNTDAIELYKKIGFEMEGRQRRAIRVDGIYEDLLCMAILFE